MSDDGDWRRQGQEHYLAGRVLKHSSWFTPAASWDHDHCEFCWAKIWDRATGEDEFDRGYVTVDDDRRWICDACFADFRSELGWSVVE